MELALDEAEAAGGRGEMPVGAVIVRDGADHLPRPATARASSAT